MKVRICGTLLNLALLLFITCSQVVSQETSAGTYDTLITPEIISRHLHILTSDSMEGRETAQLGMRKAAEYFSQQFRNYGLKPISDGSYFQKVPFSTYNATSVTLSINNKELVPVTDYFVTTISSQWNIQTDELFFAGYGITDSASGWNDYKNINVTGKVVLIADGEPFKKKGKSLITGTTEPGAWSGDSRRKIQLAKDQGARAILFISNDFERGSGRMKRWAEHGRLSLYKNSTDDVPVVYISQMAAEQLLNHSSTFFSKFKEKHTTATIKTTVKLSASPTKTTCTNVLGYIEGSDRKDEVIVITGHLDHLGKRGDKIYYGADDNGSGCAAILNMAEAFSKATSEGKRPRRSILFIAFTGEEKGLFGSEYYVENPAFPLEKTVANLNIDMIGRSDTVQRPLPTYTYIIGSDKLSTELHTLHEEANSRCCNIALDYKYNDPSDKLRLYYRSDHYNFVKNGIPAIFYFTGLHEDYHQPTDTPDKVDVAKTAAIAKLIFNTAWELANRDERIRVDRNSDNY